MISRPRVDKAQISWLLILYVLFFFKCSYHACSCVFFLLDCVLCPSFCVPRFSVHQPVHPRCTPIQVESWSTDGFALFFFVVRSWFDLSCRESFCIEWSSTIPTILSSVIRVFDCRALKRKQHLSGKDGSLIIRFLVMSVLYIALPTYFFLPEQLLWGIYDFSFVCFQNLCGGWLFVNGFVLIISPFWLLFL